MHLKMGRYGVETTLEEGRESAKSNHVEHPMGEADSPPIRRTDEGRISSTDRDPRAKRMASKHPRSKYYTTLRLRMAYSVSAPRNTLLQPPHGKRPAIRQGRDKQYQSNALYK